MTTNANSGSMDEELKPCPFCGGEASFVFYKGPGYEEQGIRCLPCHFMLPDAESWNKRTPPVTDEQVRKLVEAAKEYESESTNPAKDYTLLRIRREQLFQALASVKGKL